MAVDPQMGGAAMAAGGGLPQGGGGQPPVQTAALGGGMTTQIDEIISALKQILPQCVDEKGYVNMDKLITLWPQVMPNVPFQVVMQLIGQTPDLLNEIIAQYGLAGVTVQGRVISADELASLGGRGGR